MPIGFTQKTAKFTASSANSVTSAAISTAVGAKVIVTCAAFHNGSTYTLSVSDSKGGNTWVNDVSIRDIQTNSGLVIIASTTLVNAGAGHTFTVTCSVADAGAFFEGNASEFSQVGALDQIVQSVIAVAATTSTKTTPSTTQADELVIAALQLDSSDATCNITDPPAGYNSIGVNQDGSATIGYEAAYAIVSSIGTQSATWNFDSATAGGSAGIATYKGLAGAVNPLISPMPYYRTIVINE